MRPAVFGRDAVGRLSLTVGVRSRFSMKVISPRVSCGKACCRSDMVRVVI